MSRLRDKVCLVTGGAGSIGLATAKLFLAEGAKVMLADISEKALAEAKATLRHENLATIVGDVSKASSIENVVGAVVERWGLIDVLFSNAGNFGTVAPIESYPEATFDAVYAVRVKGAFLLCRSAAPHMRDGGSIIITSSVAGTRCDPGVYAYITAKHAQVGLMRCLAKELAPRRIRVNTIHPGPVDNSFQHDVETGLSKVMGRDGAEFFNEMIRSGDMDGPK